MDISEWLTYTARREGYLCAMQQFGLEPLIGLTSFDQHAGHWAGWQPG